MTIEYAQPVKGDAATLPDSFYGVSKAACEGLTKFYADLEDLEVVNLRIGWYMSEDDLREATGEDEDPGKDRFARALWLSPRDCRDVHRKAATVDLPENPVTVNAVEMSASEGYLDAPIALPAPIFGPAEEDELVFRVEVAFPDLPLDPVAEERRVAVE
jgi:hypothetical protein